MVTKWLKLLKRWLAGGGHLIYALVVIRLPWTQEMIRDVAGFWASHSFSRIAEDPDRRRALLESFSGDETRLRQAIELADITFFRHFPMVGLLCRPERLEDLAGLPFVEFVYAPPAEYSLDYLHILKGLHWVLEHNRGQTEEKIRVINMSLQAPEPYPFDPREPMNVATRALVDDGVIVVVAAGNQGVRGDGSLNPWAAAPWVISVGAAYGDGQRLWEHSSRGLPGSLYHPTVVAKGVGVVAPRSPESVYPVVDQEGHYAIADGASFAAPQVAGMAAVIIEFIEEGLARSPQAAEWRAKLESEFGLRTRPLTASPEAVKRLLEHFAAPMPGYAKHQQGAGFVSGEIIQERLRNFRFSDFIQAFGVPAGQTASAQL